MILGIASGRRLSYFAKSSLFKGRITSFILSQVGAFPVKRGFSDPKSIKESIKRLRNNQGLVMFPQGTRQGGKIDPDNFKPGVGMLAAKAEVPIIPVYIYGSDKAMAPKTKMIRPAKTTVYFGLPIYAQENSSYEQTTYRVMKSIEELSFQAHR